ncbi:MAG: hypothetical protein AAGJ87_04700 [Pseudomonadota bacterium]
MTLALEPRDTRAAPRLRLTDRSSTAAIFAMWAVFSFALISASPVPLGEGKMIGTDDYLRLAQIRDFLNGQSWFDVHQHRLNEPDGAPMHWSRLADLPVAAIITVLTPLVGAAAAEDAALAWTPVLFLLAVMLATGASVRRLVGRGAAIAAAGYLTAFSAILIQIMPTRIDHHALQLLCAALMFVGVTTASRGKGATLSAGAGALWLQVSVEALPYVFALSVFLALRSLIDATARRALAAYLAVLAGLSVVLFAATQPPALWNAPWCDAVTPAHLAAFIVAAFGVSPFYLRATERFGARLVVLSGAGVASAAAFTAVAPECLASPFSSLDPKVADLWYFQVGEGLAVWRLSPADVIVSYSPLIVGVIGYGFALQHACDRQARERWALAAAFFAVSVVIAVFVQRALGTAALFAAPGIAACLRATIDRFSNRTAAPMRVAIIALATIAFYPTTLQSVVAAGVRAAGLDAMPPPVRAPYMTEEGAAETDAVDPQAAMFRCVSETDLAPLAGLPRARILSPLALAPAILAHTDHTAVSSGHHRNQAAMKDVIDFFTGDEEAARSVVDRRGVDLVVTCNGLPELSRYRVYAPSGLMARIEQGDPPDWLAPASPADVPGGLRLWRVVR